MNIVRDFDVLRIAVFVFVAVGFVDAFHGTTTCSTFSNTWKWKHQHHHHKQQKPLFEFTVTKRRSVVETYIDYNHHNIHVSYFQLFVSTLFEYDDSNNYIITNRRYQRHNHCCHWEVNDRRRQSSSSFQLYAKRTTTRRRSDDNDDDDDDTASSVVNYDQPMNNRYDFNRQENKEWLMERFKFTEEQLKKRMNFLTQDNSILEGRADWLQERLGFNDKEMVKIVQGQPIILSRKTNTSLRPTLDCLEKIFGNKSLKKMALKQPRVVCTSKESIQPKLDYLLRLNNLDDSKVKSMIQKTPNILVLSIDNIIAKIDYLNQRLNSNDGAADRTDEQVSTIILKFPDILRLSISDKLEPTLTWLQQHLSLSNRKLANMIERYPQLLSCGISSNIEPTFKFYVDALGNDKSAAAAMISNNPRLLCASLTNRLIPRLGQAKDAGLTIDQGCLHRIAQYKQEDWDASLTFQCRKLDKKESNGDKELW